MQEMFEKLERLKYGRESIKQNSRLMDFYSENKWDEDNDDLDSLYEYINEHDED